MATKTFRQIAYHQRKRAWSKAQRILRKILQHLRRWLSLAMRATTYRTRNENLHPSQTMQVGRFTDVCLEEGVISFACVLNTSDRPVFTIRDAKGNAHLVKPASTEIIPIHGINLIGSSEAREEWTFSSQIPNAELGKNLNPECVVDGVSIYYVSTEADTQIRDWVATAIFTDPITDGDVPITPLNRYRFHLYAATHRCAALVKLTFKDAQENEIFEITRDIDRRFEGGKSLADFYQLKIDFESPANAISLSIRIYKGRTEEKEKSYLFFGNTALQKICRNSSLDPIDVPLDCVANARLANIVGLHRISLQVPKEVFQSSTASVDVCVQVGDEHLAMEDLSVSNKTTAEISEFSLRTSKVHFKGRFSGQIPSQQKFGLYVDGELSNSMTIVDSDGDFAGTIHINHKHLDGAPRTLELRTIPQMTRLAAICEIVPTQLTPLDVIQAAAGPPLNGALSSNASHHFRSFRAWFEKLGENPKIPLPPITELYHELQQGFKKRTCYPLLSFPEVKDPKVSIIIPLHNKFEITYFCLCSILFAFVETSFEVIVTDDGSNDETGKMEEFVNGIKIVRHKSAKGFVESCNDAAALARGEFLMFLNNDTEVTARWIDELVAVFNNFTNVGLVGAKLVYPDGRLQEAGGIVWNSGNPWNVGRNGNAFDPKFNYLRQTDYLSGAAIMLPTKLWNEIGGFSQEFAPAYFEDTDLAMKIRSVGKLVVYTPTATVYHFEGQSAGTNSTSGMKRFQEVNRPKFRRKWVQIYASHGAEGKAPEREKDRNVALRVLFIDQHVPFVDNDAGSYAAFQEVRLFQSQGAKVTFLPKNLAWMDRHTLAMQRIGVECLYAPFVMNFDEYLQMHASEYDVVYVCRYKIAQQVVPIVRSAAPNAKIIFNLADLHFLRELREAALGSPDYTTERATITRNDELAVIKSSDLTFSYSDVELAVLESHIFNGLVTAKMPWVVEPKMLSRQYEDTKDILFLGGFGHPPNLHAVMFFINEVMPLLRGRLPDARFNIVGSKAPDSLKALASESVNIVGYLPDLEDAFARSRVFVAPLMAGAGLKGKVLEAMSRGVPSVLSSVAAEGTNMAGGVNCLIAREPEEWADAVFRLYADKELWEKIGKNALSTAATQFSFQAAKKIFRDGLSKIDLFGNESSALVYKHVRPERYGL